MLWVLKIFFLYKTVDIASAFFHTFGASRPSVKHADANIYILIDSSFTPQKNIVISSTFYGITLNEIKFPAKSLNFKLSK